MKWGHCFLGADLQMSSVWHLLGPDEPNFPGLLVWRVRSWPQLAPTLLVVGWTISGSLQTSVCVHREGTRWVAFWVPFSALTLILESLSDAEMKRSMETACSQQKRPPCRRSAVEIPQPWGQLGRVVVPGMKVCWWAFGNVGGSLNQNYQTAGKRGETEFTYQCQMSKFCESMYLNCLWFLI